MLFIKAGQDEDLMMMMGLLLINFSFLSNGNRCFLSICGRSTTLSA